MKNNFKKLGTLLIIGFLAACAGSDTPKSVAEKFLKATGEYNFAEAKKYCTEETGKMMDMMESMMKMAPDSAKKDHPKFVVGEEKIDGDNASVSYKEESKEGEQVVTLKKVNDKWLVSISKEGMMGGANAGGAPQAEPAMQDSASMSATPAADTTTKK